MNIIVCTDDRGGILFNRRRQSQDRILRKKVLSDTTGKRLWMNAYSARQFFDAPPGRITEDEDFLSKAGPGEFCFAEGTPLLPYLSKIEQVILFRWNRKYPADVYLDLPLDRPPWHLTEQSEFSGHSH